SAVADTSCCNYRYRSHSVYHRWHQRQRGAYASVPSAFGALRHNKVCARLYRQQSISHVLHLAHEFAAGIFNTPSVRTWLTERQHYRVRPVPQDKIDYRGARGPRNKTCAPRLARQAGNDIELTTQPIDIAV